MSHILLKKVQDNLISPPASNYIKIFSNANNGGLLSYKDSSGTTTSIGSGGSGTTYDPVVGITYSSLYSLYQSDGFATGSFYYISDFQSIYDQPDFYFDGTPKTVLENKVSTSYPIIVLATSKNTLATDAYQPDFPNDAIKYDISWNETELGNSAKGRITERIDQDGNRTDYDHKTIRFKRYLDYERVGSSLNGTITSWNCITGTVSGSGTQFNTDLSIDDVIVLDSSYTYGGDKNYTIGLKVKTIINNTTIIVATSSLYAAGVPVDVTLSNSTLIEPENYSFVTKNYTFWLANSTADYSSYKEIYFGQSDDNEFDESYTFQSAQSNYIGNYSHNYLSASYNNTLILSNNVFRSNCQSNRIGDDSHGNTVGDNFKFNNIKSFKRNIIGNNSQYNEISVDFYDNVFLLLNQNKIGGYLFHSNNVISMEDNMIQCLQFSNNQLKSFSHNNIYSEQFSYNIVGNFFNYNNIRYDFTNNNVVGNFKYNNINSDIDSVDFTLTPSTHVSGSYTCEIFNNSLGVTRLSYYDGSDVKHVTDITL